MKNKNREFEETGAFLDVMSKRERKRWEKEQAKLKKQEQNNFEEEMLTENNEVEEEPSEEIKTVQSEEASLENQEVTKEIMEPIGTTLSSEELEHELEKTKEIMALTDEIPAIKTKKTQTETIEDDENEDDEEEEKSYFNPVPLIGFILVAVIAFFIYIFLNSEYDNETFILVNSAIAVVLTFFFGLTALSNQRHVKAFFIIDLLIILGFVIFNGVSIVNYDNIYNKLENNDKKQEEIDKEPTEPMPDEEEIDDKEENKGDDITNEYNCVDDDAKINIQITEKDGYITYITRSEVFESDKDANEIIKFYEDIEGIESELEDTTLTINIDLSNVDIEDYKGSLENHNDYYRLESDFSYIDKDKIKFDLYEEIELKSLTCERKENN